MTVEKKSRLFPPAYSTSYGLDMMSQFLTDISLPVSFCCCQPIKIQLEALMMYHWLK